MIDYETQYLSGALPLPPLDRLIAAHSKLFRGERPVCWSEFPEGWFDLIHGVCCGIERMLSDEELARFEVLQIKQKLGSLRLYFRFDRDSPKAQAIREMLGQAAEMSCVTCEVCGARGALDSNQSDGMAALRRACMHSFYPV